VAQLQKALPKCEIISSAKNNPRISP